jgi:hypothetical protein
LAVIVSRRANHATLSIDGACAIEFICKWRL